MFRLVSAGMKRLMLPNNLRELLIPNYVDRDMPTMHFMKCKWSKDVVKFGLMSWYSRFFLDQSAKPSFIDYCTTTTTKQLTELNLESLQFSRYNLLVKPHETKGHLHKAFFESQDCEQLSTSKCLADYPWIESMVKDKNRLVFRVSDFMLDSRLEFQTSGNRFFKV